MELVVVMLLELLVVVMLLELCKWLMELVVVTLASLRYRVAN